MKKVLCLLIAMVLTGSSFAIANERIDKMTDVNKDISLLCDSYIEDLMDEYKENGNDSDEIAVLMRWYLEMYYASYRINVALLRVELDDEKRSDGKILEFENFHKGETRNYLNQYEKYLNGEMTAAEYIEEAYTEFRTTRMGRKNI